MTTDRPLTLDVTDFGPIARGCVELRPLTVFVGPSNTGKSWLATLVYSLHRYFGTDPHGWHPWFQMRPDAPNLPKGAETDLVRIAEQLTESAPSAEPMAEGPGLTRPVEAAIQLHLKEQGGALGEEIERCFGLNCRRLVRNGARRARILLRLAVEGGSKPAEHELTLGVEGGTFLPTIPEGIRIRDKRYRRLFAGLLIPAQESRQGHFRRVWDAVEALALAVLPNPRPAFYLPADRTGLMSAHSTVVSNLFQDATLTGRRRVGPLLPPLSGVRADFQQQLVEMVSDQRNSGGRERLEQLGRRIEDGILGGSIQLWTVSGVAYPHFTYLPSGWELELPLTSSSSMVSELAPVVLYLRHVIAPDDLLIIDEPESHLHPAKQVAFTRQIAEIVRAGVRVIVTTHSEWVLEELGNIVGRGRMTDGDAGNTDAASLGADDVGVWLFEPAGDGGGSTVKEIALDAATGLYPSGFDTVARALHNDWAAIADPHGDAE